MAPDLGDLMQVANLKAGWYEFNIESGGLWNILRYSEDINDWKLLKSGGSTAIHMNQATNHLTAV